MSNPTFYSRYNGAYNFENNLIMYIKVKVLASAKKEEIKKKSDTNYFISVKEKAERNMANKRVCEIMASLFGVTTKSVRIVNGHQSPSKMFLINLPENLV